MGRSRSDKHKPKRKRYYTVRYKQTPIRIPKNPRTGVCQGCGRSVKKKEIKRTHIHHWRYDYLPETVKANPMYVLNNTNEFCFRPCHRAADALRMLTYDITPTHYPTIVKVAKLMPRKQRKRLIELCHMFINAEVDKNGKI